MAEFADLSDEEFRKRSIRFYSERYVFAFSTILSLNWAKLQDKKPKPFLRAITAYTLAKAEKHCNKGAF